MVIKENLENRGKLDKETLMHGHFDVLPSIFSRHGFVLFLI